MVTLDRKFGGFALSEANGISVAQHADTILIESEFAPKQQGEGSLFHTQLFTGRELKLSGAIRGTTNDNARTRLDAFLAAMTNGEQYYQLFSDRALLCRLSKDVALDPSEGTVFGAYEWSCVLRSRWPTWERQAATLDTFAWTTTVQYQALSANVGTAQAWPRILITENGPGFQGRQLILVNASTDRQLSLQGVSMNPGQTFSVDMREGRIHDGLGAEITTLGIEGSWWPIGAGGSQTLQLETNIAAPDFTVSIEHHAQYWAP